MQPGRCRWPSRHDLNDERFAWCGEPVEHAGGPYCSAHAARAVSTEDAAPESIEVDNRTYRLLIRDRTLGGRRRWVERVPSGVSVPERRGVDSVVDAERGMGSPTASTAPQRPPTRPASHASI
jgi:hypothetical protein